MSARLCTRNVDFNVTELDVHNGSMNKIQLQTFSLAALVLCGCGKETQKSESCDLAAQTGCEDGLVCEAVVDGEPACFAPVRIEGTVFDLADHAAIAAATVVALDANGAAQTDVVRTDASGRYSLWVPTVRTQDGQPQMEPVTLRIAAAGYQPFPLAPRTALPIDVELVEGDAAIDNATTQVGLVALPSATGTVLQGSLGAKGAGALVVAEIDGAAVATAVAGADGTFVLFDLPAGDVMVSAYRQGVYAAPEAVVIKEDQDATLNITVAEATGSVSGTVNIVNAEGGAETSVILVLESTFEEQLSRGESPGGLRVAGVTGAFRFENVPPGRYVVLAAYENDDLVRDPDEGIAGTEIVHIEVPAQGEVELPQSFKVTGALQTVGPGVDELEKVTGTPELSWGDDSSEDGYELRIFDALGNLVYEDTEVPRMTGSETVSYSPEGVAFDSGMVYQFRVWSFRERNGGRTYISATEDLRGTFLVN